MAANSGLPQELIDEVIDCLEDDFVTLKACSLVSWAWVSRCRSSLFETCVLTSENVADFRDLLLSAECTFSSDIRRIKASRYTGSPDDHVFDDIMASMRDLDIRELSIHIRLSSLHNDAYPYFCTGFITAFSRATRLDLGFSTENYWAHVSMPLLETITLFPALRELCIFELWEDTQDSAIARVPPSNLHCLELHGTSIISILGWLSASNHLPNVDSLTLPSVNNHEASIVRATMQQIAGNLHYLDIDLENWGVDHSAIFDLSLHPNLKTLIIRDKYGRVEFLLPIVTSLAAPTLEHLSLELDVPLYEEFDWEALDEFLSGPQFPNLRRVMVKCTRHYGRGCHDDHIYVYAGSLPVSGVLQTEW